MRNSFYNEKTETMSGRCPRLIECIELFPTPRGKCAGLLTSQTLKNCILLYLIKFKKNNGKKIRKMKKSVIILANFPSDTKSWYWYLILKELMLILEIIFFSIYFDCSAKLLSEIIPTQFDESISLQWFVNDRTNTSR